MEEGLMAPPAAMKEALGLDLTDIRTYSPLALAYVGDAVYELLIRTRVACRGSRQVDKMHRKSASLVKAAAQAQMIRALMEELTEEEMAVYRRGRNAKPRSMAKHATVIDYRMATGFEALMGYLYLTSRFERLLELAHDGLARIGELEESAEAGEDGSVDLIFCPGLEDPDEEAGDPMETKTEDEEAK